MHFALALEAPHYTHPDIYTAQVYASVLGGGMSSRLFQDIRESRGLCYTIFAQAGAYEDTGLTTIYAGTSAEQIGELAELTVDVLRQLPESLTVEEVDRARTQMKAGMLMGLESPSNRAERLARHLSIWGRVQSVDETVERIDAVDVAAGRRFGEELASRAGSALALYGPIDAAPSLGDLRARLAA